MRDLLFRNLTSLNKRRKVLASSEIFEREGVRSIIRRHFVYMVKEVKGQATATPENQVYILKKHSSKEQKEKFFCKIKGSLSAVNQGKVYSIYYLHSLQVNLTQIGQEALQ